MGRKIYCFSDFLPKALGTRTTCNPNLAGSHHQEFPALKLVSVFLKHGIEVINFGLQGCSWKPKEHDAGMGKLLVKDQLAEIPVSDDQSTLFFPGDCQDILIRNSVAERLT